MADSYSGSNGSGRLVYGWLMLAVASLVFAGLFALLLASARTPGIEQLLPFGRDYIFIALVGHVVLAVVIWFLAFEGFLWAYSTTVYLGRAPVCPTLGWVSLALTSSGVALVIISALFGLGPAELANYVPVLITPVFYAALGLFGAGIFLQVLLAFAALARARAAWVQFPQFTLGMAAAAFAVFIAAVCFALSWYSQTTTGKAFIDFERLFWGGGHVLQFANTISMVTVWCLLVRIIYGKYPIGARGAGLLYLIYILFILPAPAIYFIHDTAAQAHKESFTTLMQWGLGPSTALFTLAVAYVMAKDGISLKRPGSAALLLSMLIFAIGGFIAVTIRGVNTIIPAHYHSAIGAVTIAFMGLFYEAAPTVRRRLYSVKLAAVQPYIYFFGILLFAAGLYIAGYFGVARKTYGEAQNLDRTAKFVGMAVMGIGGLVSIIGGITFVINALGTLLSGRLPDADDAPLDDGRVGRG